MDPQARAQAENAIKSALIYFLFLVLPLLFLAACFFVDALVALDFFLPKAEPQLSEYFFVEPDRVMLMFV